MTTKVTGLGSTVIVADAGAVARTISNDISNYTFSTPRGVQDTTGVDKSAHEALLLLADFSVTFNGILDPGSNLSHAVFSSVPSTSVARATTITPTSATTPTMTCNVLYSDYQITRAATGEVTWSAPGQLSDGNVPTWA